MLTTCSQEPLDFDRQSARFARFRSKYSWRPWRLGGQENFRAVIAHPMKPQSPQEFPAEYLLTNPDFH